MYCIHKRVMRNFRIARLILNRRFHSCVFVVVKYSGVHEQRYRYQQNQKLKCESKMFHIKMFLLLMFNCDVKLFRKSSRENGNGNELTLEVDELM